MKIVEPLRQSLVQFFLEQPITRHLLSLARRVELGNCMGMGTLRVRVLLEAENEVDMR